MSIDEKLRTIDYICRDCERAFSAVDDCAYLSGEYIKFRRKAEERFEYCYLLRKRINNIERVFNSIHIEDIQIKNIIHGTVESKDI